MRLFVQQHNLQTFVGPYGTWGAVSRRGWEQGDAGMDGCEPEAGAAWGAPGVAVDVTGDEAKLSR